MDIEHFFVVVSMPRGDDDLRIGRVYRASEDAAGKHSGYIRVGDDCGEDYLYPERKPANRAPSHDRTPVRVIRILAQ